MIAEESELCTEDGIKARLVRRNNRDKALALLLVKLLFFEHADFVIGGVHAPILDVEIELRQIEVRAHSVTTQDAEAFVVPIGNPLGGQPVSNETLAVRLDEGTGPGDDGFI